MPCSNPILIQNKKKDKISPIDPDGMYVPCGYCYECRKRYGNDWRIRLLNEIRYSPSNKNYFVTLSISDEYYGDFESNHRLAIRKFLERYRKKYGVSCRHWVVTELGENTSRLHFHGILFDCKLPFDVYNPNLPFRQNLDFHKKALEKMWSYGFVYVGYCSERTASYIVKYITKAQKLSDGTYFKPKVYTSPNMGKAFCDDPLQVNYIRSLPVGQYTYKHDGFTYALPRYYKNKIFTEDELFEVKTIQYFDPPPYRLKDKSYPPNPYGQAMYMLDLEKLDYFNSTFYGQQTSHREFLRLRRQETSERKREIRYTFDHAGLREFQ